MSNPPKGVKLVMEGVCIMLQYHARARYTDTRSLCCYHVPARCAAMLLPGKASQGLIRGRKRYCCYHPTISSYDIILQLCYAIILRLRCAKSSTATDAHPMQLTYALGSGGRYLNRLCCYHTAGTEIVYAATTLLVLRQA
eukprot:706899-Rhodomonas_salina.2